uniref:Pteropsin protein n=1 Tax=Anax parthenope TaxID=126066 RepID=A0A0C6G2W9_ANAPR|nr:opsin, pteropsin type [Anax parthenope]
MKSPWETEVDGAGGGNEVGGGDATGQGSEEEERLLMSPGGYAAAAVALLLIGLVGFLSNLLVMIIMCRNKQLWTPLNVILFNLVCSDFSVSILGNPITLTAALFRRWIFGRTMCVIYGFFMSLLGIASITTLMVLSFERYVMISKPFQVHRLTQKGAVALIGAIWVYALFLTVPPLLGWGDYVHESANISCSVNWESKTMNATTYIIFLFAMGLVVPVFVISFSYLNIIWTMKKNALSMGRVTKAESRVTLMVFVMIVAFLVAWTPYSVLALLVAFGDASMISPGVAVVPALMAKSSICYNPVIYVGLNTQFRSAWHKLLGVRVISETSQEVGGEHTAVLSPSHYMSNTLADGGATGTTATSASGIFLAPATSNTSNSSSPILAATLRKKVAAVLAASTGNGEAAKPPIKSTASWAKISVVDALPEEVEEDTDCEEGNEEGEVRETNLDDVMANGDVESGTKEERGEGGGEKNRVVENGRSIKRGEEECKTAENQPLQPAAGVSEPQRAVTTKKRGRWDGDTDGSGPSEREGGKGRRLRGGGFLRGRGRKFDGSRGPRKVVAKGNGVVSDGGRRKGKHCSGRGGVSRASEITVTIEDEVEDEEVEMKLLSKPEAEVKQSDESEVVEV